MAENSTSSGSNSRCSSGTRVVKYFANPASAGSPSIQRFVALSYFDASGKHPRSPAINTASRWNECASCQFQPRAGVAANDHGRQRTGQLSSRFTIALFFFAFMERLFFSDLDLHHPASSDEERKGRPENSINQHETFGGVIRCRYLPVRVRAA